MLKQMVNRRLGAIFIILISSLLAAQPRPQAPNTGTQTTDQKAIIQGTVIKAGTGQPLKRARVSLRRQGQSAAGQLPSIQEAVGNLGAGNVAQISQTIQAAIGSMNAQAVTDDGGHFTFVGVDPGQYRI